MSNYDPKKNQYVRQNDPERNTAKNKRQVTRSAAPTMSMDDDYERQGRKKRKQAQVMQPKPEPVKIEKAVMTSELITVKDLSEKIGKSVNEIIKKLLMLGIMATINNELDYDTAQLICSDYGIELELTDYVSESCGAEILYGCKGVLNAVGIELCICYGEEYHRIYLHGNIILCDNGLGLEVHYLLLDGDTLCNPVDEGDHKVGACVKVCLECTEALNYIYLSLRYYLYARKDDDKNNYYENDR